MSKEVTITLTCADVDIAAKIMAIAAVYQWGEDHDDDAVPFLVGYVLGNALGYLRDILDELLDEGEDGHLVLLRMCEMQHEGIIRQLLTR